MHQHEEQQLKQMGLQQHEVDQMKAHGLDFAKILTLIRTILSLFGGAQSQQAPGQQRP